MHPEVFTNKQSELINYLSVFSRTFYLVGGTAIALHIGHRRSIDFDLFRYQKLNKLSVKRKLKSFPFSQQLFFEDYDQMHWIINDVKVTFFSYPYEVEHNIKFGSYFTMPDLLSLAAMKAFALGRRAKWKDYVDLYFIIKDHFNVTEISRKAEKLFSTHFSEKLFREQLAYHKDIDYTEKVDYLIEPPSDKEIKEFLINEGTRIL